MKNILYAANAKKSSCQEKQPSWKRMASVRAPEVPSTAHGRCCVWSCHPGLGGHPGETQRRNSAGVSTGDVWGFAFQDVVLGKPVRLVLAPSMQVIIRGALTMVLLAAPSGG